MKGLYLVTDRAQLGAGLPLIDVVEQAIAGGVRCVQLREKSASTREMLQLGQALLERLRPRGIPLLINDRVDVALAIGADGVHLGQTDMPYLDARRLLGEQAIIGVSVETLPHVTEANAWDVQYLGVSGIFPTPTKPELQAHWGLEGLAQVRKQTRHPLVAIGGIHAQNAAAVRAHGADAIALVSAICAAADPQQAAQQLQQAFAEGA
jgi:thiamine-phosphate pyrophosphorylase